MKKLFKDIKIVFIIVLAIALILSLLSKPSSTIDTYKEEINLLKKHNKELGLSNDSLTLTNGILQEEINIILRHMDSTEVILIETETKLTELEKRRNEVSDITSNMVSDDITYNISDYLKRRGTGGH